MDSVNFLKFYNENLFGVCLDGFSMPPWEMKFEKFQLWPAKFL